MRIEWEFQRGRCLICGFEGIVVVIKLPNLFLKPALCRGCVTELCKCLDSLIGSFPNASLSS